MAKKQQQMVGNLFIFAAEASFTHVVYQLENLKKIVICF